MKRRKLDPDLRRIIDREEWLEALRKMHEERNEAVEAVPGVSREALDGLPKAVVLDE